jgi:hypothetical protein
MKLSFRILFALFAIGGIALPAWKAESLQNQGSTDDHQVGIPYDWTHRHVFFSGGSSVTTGRAKNFGAIPLEPRYWIQQLRRRQRGAAETELGHEASRLLLDFTKPRTTFKRDWTQTFQKNGVTYTLTSPTYPAEFSLLATPSCSKDFLVFTLPTGGSTFPGNFNIIAFNNLYVSAAGGSSFCPGTQPQAIFEYNASSAGGTLNGSPVLSLDGNLIAFVENATPANGGAVLHILKWHSGDKQGVDVNFPNAFNNAALADCATNGATAPCQYSMQYTPSGSRQSATLSSPFVDYNTDTAYVSDDGGNIYAISPVFGATPANPPALLSGYPMNVGSALVLTPPVYDSVSRNVFVAGTTGTVFFFRTLGSTTGPCSSGRPPCLGANTFAFTPLGSIFEGPIVDSSTGKVFIFGTQVGLTTGSFAIQTNTILGPGSVKTGQIGAGTLNTTYTGTFDNNYFTDVVTGKLYACGQNISGEGQLYAFGFTAAGVMKTTGAGVSGPFALGQGTTTNSPCSSGLAENFNQSANKDWLFLGVKDRCVNTMFGGNGCVISFDITSAFPAAVAHQIAVGGGAGPSGIVVDNATDASASQITTDIYYILPGGQSCPDYLGSNHTGTCAGSATQSGLQ